MESLQRGRSIEVASGVEARLSEAWEFLSGEAWRFRRIEASADATSPCGRTAVLPLTLADRSECACRLVISTEHARLVAAHLFGVPPTDITAADLEDALREACNVLGSCLAAGLPASLGPSIGLPFVAVGAIAPAGAESGTPRPGFRPESHGDPRLDVLLGRVHDRSTGIAQ